MTVTVSGATGADVDELADVAAITFPLACPPSTKPADVAAFIAANLCPGRFADYLAAPDRTVLTARHGRRLIGYAMLIRGVADDPDVRAAVEPRPAVELSKMYVLPDAHGTGVGATLIEAALWRSHDLGAACVWLGVNEENQRAQRFYGKHGFTVTGTKTFRIGAVLEHDYVMVRRLADATAAGPTRSA